MFVNPTKLSAHSAKPSAESLTTAGTNCMIGTLKNAHAYSKHTTCTHNMHTQHAFLRTHPFKQYHHLLPLVLDYYCTNKQHIKHLWTTAAHTHKARAEPMPQNAPLSTYGITTSNPQMRPLTTSSHYMKLLKEYNAKFVDYMSCNPSATAWWVYLCLILIPCNHWQWHQHYAHRHRMACQTTTAPPLWPCKGRIWKTRPVLSQSHLWNNLHHHSQD